MLLDAQALDYYRAPRGCRNFFGTKILEPEPLFDGKVDIFGGLRSHALQVSSQDDPQEVGSWDGLSNQSRQICLGLIYLSVHPSLEGMALYQDLVCLAQSVAVSVGRGPFLDTRGLLGASLLCGGWLLWERKKERSTLAVQLRALRKEAPIDSHR
eukprot:1152573-Pelagomonas_calceolata.AAC.1